MAAMSRTERYALALALGLFCFWAGSIGPIEAAGRLDDLRPSLMLDHGAFAAAAAPVSSTLAPGGGAADLPWFLAPLNPRNALLAVHLVGLSIGFGGALILDAWLLSWMVRGRQSQSVGTAFELIGAVVSIGLLLLWISGLGFLILYSLTDPAKLANPKLWGKIGIVSILTLNGFALHRWVMPMTLKDVHQPLFSGATLQARLIGLASGSVSAASWVSAFLLGLLKELNGRIGVLDIVHCWTALLLLAFLGANLLLLARAGFRTVVPAHHPSGLQPS
ncbi:hypothetical protein ASG62_12065 [Aureimonas sp. Leaf427]|nr:hypothetical protein ASG62_12065 [Aureimonas sp. Leaf427]